MIVSFVVAVYLEIIHPGLYPEAALSGSLKLVIGVAITTAAWIGVTLMTKPADESTLRSFYALTRPGGPGWKPVLDRAAAEGTPVVGTGDGWVVPQGILAMVAGCFAVYSALFAIGYWIYGRYAAAALLSVIAVAGAVYLARAWGRVSGASAGPEVAEA
jgi:solute:Na+ symporter, SSS family